MTEKFTLKALSSLTYPPVIMSSFVIFWLTPPLPLWWWRHLWTAPKVGTCKITYQIRYQTKDQVMYQIEFWESCNNVSQCCWWIWLLHLNDGADVWKLQLCAPEDKSQEEKSSAYPSSTCPQSFDFRMVPCSCTCWLKICLFLALDGNEEEAR